MQRYSDYLKEKFNSKVIKIPLDYHNSCPNKINGGCIYCKDNSKSNITDTSKDLLSQFYDTVKHLSNKWPNAKYIAYFQSGTNTYMSLFEFKKMIKTFLNKEDIVGIAIATRPDCINDEYLEYLDKLNKKTYLEIELGLQTSNDLTLKLINRGHDSKEFAKMVKKLHKKNIFVCAHIINGLPTETEKDMLNTIKFLNKLKIDAIKIHMLSILKDTLLAKSYLEKPFHLLNEEEYINIIKKQIKILNKNVIVERLTGDPIKEDLIAPTWYTNKKILLNKINKEIEKYVI